MSAGIRPFEDLIVLFGVLLHATHALRRTRNIQKASKYGTMELQLQPVQSQTALQLAKPKSSDQLSQLRVGPTPAKAPMQQKLKSNFSDMLCNSENA